jgi:hypothetical protein
MRLSMNWMALVLMKKRMKKLNLIRRWVLMMKKLMEQIIMISRNLQRSVVSY